jgi:alpha-1,2-mannosyltransferase
MIPLFEKSVRLLLTSRAIQLAVIFWVLYAVILSIVVAVDPDRRTVTPNYRQAAEKWWHGEEDIYFAKKKGFLYLPQSAILYSPFTFGPKRVGEPLWRIVSLGVLAWGIWRATRLVAPPGTNPAFALVTAFVIPSSFASAGNGQMNILLSALMLHTAVDWARSNNLRAAAWLCIAFCLKPLALVFLLLAFALEPKLRLPLVVGLLLSFAIPFLHPDPAYVWSQFVLGSQVMLSASQPDQHNFCDLSGMFLTFGLELPSQFWTATRLVMAAVTLVFGWIAMRRHPAPWGEFFVLALASTYLMLFNPRTEANTYILLSPVVALIMFRAFSLRGQVITALLLCLYLVALGVDSYGPLHRPTNLWLKALLTVGFGVYLARSIITDKCVLPTTNAPA